MAGTPTVLRKANGVLPIAQGQPPTVNSSKGTKGKVPMQGQKVVIRRLAPGMTEQECLNLLGDEWHPGNGRIGWFSFHAGKVSNDPSKPSRPSRAYLHVLRSEDTMPLVEHVRNTEWADAKDSWTSSSLVGPPVLELSIYKKVPNVGKMRNDARQGTIDQDPEFMDFLEALANPATNKDPEAGHTAEEDDKLSAKVTSTPLIEYLREKKANKAKDAASAKAAKHSRHESSTVKGKGSEESKKKSKDSKTDKSSDRLRETVRILTKKAATDAAAEAANTVASQLAAAAKEDSSKSRRAGIAAAARILQRDLGLSPGNAHRRARQEAAKVESEATKAKASPASAASSAAPSNKASAKDASGPASTAAEAAATSVARQLTLTAPKPQAAASSSRNSRKKGGADDRKGREKKGATEKAVETTSTAPKTPVAILKKKEEPPPAAAALAAAAVATSNAPASPAAEPPAKAPPSGPKASQGKSSSGSGSQKKGGGSGGGGGSPAVSAGATRAFVKHANPSQGVTEALLKEAMRVFGGVTFVEIDRRKGFAYVDFADHESLVKAIAANPVSVAQANVQVLERKDTGKKAPTSSGGTTTTTTGDNVRAGAGTSDDAGKGSSGASKPAPKAPKGESGGGGSDSQAPSGPSAAADKASADHKRSGRRRGGRGRGGGGADGQGKEKENFSGGKAQGG